MKESQIQSLIIAYLRHRGAWCAKWSDRFLSGMPDVVAVIDGEAFFFEVKAPTGKITRIQDHTLAMISRAGGHAYVVRSVNDVKRAIEREASPSLGLQPVGFYGDGKSFS